ncbi:2-oxoglutarate dehydrogenase E1 component [Candidatus Kinetoplastibacterium sorsogonicusi]|nr:2-oxoglutarate dehydrogenase E1 component [Candidatus Kinetoplastibacterium sorsogonicusi]
MSSNKDLLSNSYLFGTNASYIEELYENYIKNPSSVKGEWRNFFDKIQNSSNNEELTNNKDIIHSSIIDHFIQISKNRKKYIFKNTHESEINDNSEIFNLINAYRLLGHHNANLDPLKIKIKDNLPELDPLNYNLTKDDLNKPFNSKNTYFQKSKLSLKEAIELLKKTYCSSIGLEYMHISNASARNWIQEKMESTLASKEFNKNEKINILNQLTISEGLEKFLHTTYVGQKRFSLEGGESFIVSMDEAVNSAAKLGVEEIVIGMAHRGRLNLLVNIMGKRPRDLFDEFEGKYAQNCTDGDVKYHNGFSSDVTTRSGNTIHLSLAFNPSHLEIVNPVVEGSVRVRQEKREKESFNKVLPILVHGDSAFAGQGVVMETLNLSQTRGYTTGGTLHIIINNQIGFTTSNIKDTRSTEYCTGIAKSFDAPIFHVNGDDPEAVAFVTQLALEYRMIFNHDIVIDIICFRKLGHNEQDTPSLTQPIMYKHIAQHPGTRKLYADKLVAEKILENNDVDNFVKNYRDILNDGSKTIVPIISSTDSQYSVNWSSYLNIAWTNDANTAVPYEKLKQLGHKITTVPESFKLHTLVAKLIKDRRRMIDGEINLDYGMGEHLAFASLLDDGYPVRITGQDSGRGTFTHRHAVLHNQDNSDTYIPLQNLSEYQAKFKVVDSVLSEEAVLGFEYGYSCSAPNILTIWEAQFGDFANGAQVVIDQFISSGEAKWGRQSGLTMMLPHGYEGQGPEHSSARIERFLQLCADNNMQVVQPTTAAQIFHLLRRQMVRLIRKPLVIFTPKSLLRNKDASSILSDFTDKNFQPIIGEIDNSIQNSSVKKIIFCSGKVYYDLLHYRTEKNLKNVAIIRIEQIYPITVKDLNLEINKYFNAVDIVWVQDEPKNQGAWSFINKYIYDAMLNGQKLRYSGRIASSSPAVGYMSKHQEQQKSLIAKAFSNDIEIFLSK